MTTSRKHGGSEKGYRKIREIIAILKNQLRADRPQKKSKTTAEQAAPLVQVRYILIVPKDEPQSRNMQWNLPKGWRQIYSRNDHRGNVYCLEVPLNVCSTNIENVSSFEPIASRYGSLSIALDTFNSFIFVFPILMSLSKVFMSR